MSKEYGKLPLVIDAARLAPWVTNNLVESKSDLVQFADKRLRDRTCPGADFTGWLEPKSMLPAEELIRVKDSARRLREQTDTLVVIGIGGSYLGARAVIEALSDTPERVLYAGNNVSPRYLTDLHAKLLGKNVAINVVSKSGTTTEPAVAFRILKDLVPKDKASERIVATTDAQKGALREMAERTGYETFVVPDDVGGRYSVLSAVGLLPIAYAGVDVDALVAGAEDCARLCAATADPLKNPAAFYAAARNALYGQGFAVELLASFEPRLHYVAEWWKQLFGESEGKENMALFPASVDYTTDLHSLGQYVQQGRRMLFETFLIADGGEPAVTIPKWDSDSDGLNYLAERQVSEVNEAAYKATAMAHYEGSVPNLTINLREISPYSLGALIYFFEVSCAISGLMLGVNPFSQPGVEAYKKHMFSILGKPGHEQEMDQGGETEVSIAF
jgi:glucose-6-phosphate isomerase